MALAKLVKKRKVAISCIVEVHNLAIKAKTDNSKQTLFKVSYEGLETYFDEFNKYHNEIIGLIETDADFDVHEAIRKETYHFYLTTKAVYSEIFPVLEQNSRNLTLTSNNQTEVRLPKLTVQSFNGDLRKWPMFFDVYCSLVHENNCLQDIQKFQYLLSFLEGEPLNILRSIQTVGSNYEIAFQTLKNRYQNKRLLATTYWNAIVNANSLKNNSGKELRSLLDIFSENIASLEVLQFPVEHWCFVLFNMLLKKLDSSIRTSFEIQYSKVELPTYKNLKDFLDNHCRALESIQYMPSSISSSNKSSKPMQTNSNTNKSQFYNNNNSKPQYTSSFLTHTTTQGQNSTQGSNINNSTSYNRNFSQNSNDKCRLCKNQSHSLSQCSAFISKSPNERFVYVKQQNACLNCLRYNHLVKNCSSSYNCRICRYRHHTLIHLPQSSTSNNHSQNNNFVQPSNSQQIRTQNTLENSSLVPNQIQSQNSSQNSLQNSSLVSNQTNPNSLSINCGCTSLSSFSSRTTILLSTAIVQILDSRGNYQTVKALLDSASQANFISQNCINRLGLPRQGYSIPIQGLNQSSSFTKGVTNCTIRPVNHQEPIFSLNVFVVPKLCSNMPSIHIEPSNWSHISNLNLADKQFNVPSTVDMLLGAEIYAQILKSGRISGSKGQPTALETVFGWILLGPIQDVTAQYSPLESYFTFVDPPLETTLRKFWELEATKPKIYLSPDDQRCENLYKETTSRDKSGRFVVSYPFRHTEPDLGDTYSLAYRSFLSLEARLFRNPDLYIRYSEFMKEYLNNGHMSLVPNNQPQPTIQNYLPHLCVITPQKVTTKLRVVFNASAKGSKGLSLNDNLLTGPKLQKDITEILLKFRSHTIVFLADIKQMYLQILINPSQRKFQRLLWRFNLLDPIQTYELNGVTFGVSSSPYLAIRTLKELATLESNNYPKASKILLEDTFMDDVCTGSETLEQALVAKRELVAILKTAGFELRKWASNSQEFLADLSPLDCQMPVSFDKEEPSSIKVLGLQWNPSSDTFSYLCNPSDKPCTKRNILSEIARIYDPLGFLSPVAFFAKYIMQRLWSSKIDWDDIPSQAIVDLWSQFKTELSDLSSLSIPRHVLGNHIQRCQVLGFCDASEIGYASAVYLRVESQDNVKTSLIIAKSKVAPLRTISVPRLELLGATLLADLLDFVIQTYSLLVTIDEIIAFTDSQIVLAWLASSPHKWKSFVANRVSHIQEIIPSVSWYHIPSLENPADCASRGLTPKDILSHPLWFHGPPWINSPRLHWKLENQTSQNDLNELKIEKKPLVLTTLIEQNFLDDLTNNISSLPKIQRILSYCLKFVYNIKNKNKESSIELSRSDIHKSLLVLAKRVQEQNFSDLIFKIKNNQLIPKPFRKLAPFLDEQNLVRVGGRLRHSELSYASKHPILLPRDSRLSELLINQIHIQNHHTGLNTIQYLLVQQFWVLSSRRAIKKVLSNCVRCFRLKPKTYTPYMGDLPSFRVSQLKCFSHVTLDYAGPFKITMGKYRGAKVLKAYVCIFVCSATKAIHIELVSDLTSEAFIAAFRRFIARRGVCVEIWSDCGTNFVGANRQLQELSKYSSESLNIIWHFNPPAAPHFNGLSEAGVKSVKTHLYRVVGNQVLTYEELYTLLSQIEALLNSRPLCEQSPDPNDLSPLTPGHFLTLEPLESCPDPDLSHLKLSTLSRWQLIQRLHADFWKRWKSEYLHTLQQRAKWTEPSVNIELNTLVLLKDETRPPLHWSLGRIVALHPGPDGIIRVVTVKTKDGLFKRPIVKLCPLPIIRVND